MKLPRKHKFSLTACMRNDQNTNSLSTLFEDVVDDGSEHSCLWPEWHQNLFPRKPASVGNWSLSQILTERFLRGRQGCWLSQRRLFPRRYPSVLCLNVNDTHSFSSSALRGISTVAFRQCMSILITVACSSTSIQPTKRLPINSCQVNRGRAESKCWADNYYLAEQIYAKVKTMLHLGAGLSEACVLSMEIDKGTGTGLSLLLRFAWTESLWKTH